jgi:hypothetical protein
VENTENLPTIDDIDTALGERRYRDMYRMSEQRVRANADDYEAYVRAGLALYRMGDYREACDSWLASFCREVHETSFDELTTELVSLYISARAIVILCQLRSLGGTSDLAALQMGDLLLRMEMWKQANPSLLDSESDKSLLRELQSLIDKI